MHIWAYFGIWIYQEIGLILIANKLFKSDSQRLALSLRVELSVYSAVVKFSVCVAHTLIGR
ncbi:hypothetical protein CTT30_06290 [Vibrio coralliilyticus]|nr:MULTISPECIES: hypothetical protein [Vibrio]USD95726.1 hypothetical protein CTT30_06290 [Vibrio coralliilyticus]